MFTIALRFKGCPFLCFNLFELTELLINVWTNRELLLILLVALWIPVLKFALFIYASFSIKIKYLFPKKHCKQVLIALYLIACIGAALNLVEKIAHHYQIRSVVVLLIVYAFILYMDLLETKEVLKKLREEEDTDSK